MSKESDIIRKGHNAVQHLYGVVVGTYYGVKAILPLLHTLPTFARETRESIMETPYLDARMEELGIDSEHLEGGLEDGLMLGGLVGIVAQIPISDFYWDNPHLLAIPVATNFASYIYETRRSKNKPLPQNTNKENDIQR